MRHEIVATFKPCQAETFQVTIRASSAYPDALDECRVQAVRAVSEMVTDMLEQYRKHAQAVDTGPAGLADSDPG